jgi:hypothetical protein
MRAILVLREVRIYLCPILAYMRYLRSVFNGSVRGTKNGLAQEVHAMPTVPVSPIDQGHPNHIQTMNLVKH